MDKILKSEQISQEINNDLEFYKNLINKKEKENTDNRLELEMIRNQNHIEYKDRQKELEQKREYLSKIRAELKGEFEEIKRHHVKNDNSIPFITSKISSMSSEKNQVV